jgi:hypothetical protein
MVHQRNVPPIFRLAYRYRCIWQSETEVDGGIDDWENDVLQTQAEMYVRQVQTRPEAGMTWRLDWIEEEMGLPNGEKTGLSNTQRRDRICARLRSWRIPTMDLIHMIAVTYAGSKVQVVMDYPAHFISIYFWAVPENLSDLQNELNRIIPARLGVAYIIIYVTWGDCREVGLDWCQPDAAGWTWDYLENSGRHMLPTWADCSNPVP